MFLLAVEQVPQPVLFSHEIVEPPEHAPQVRLTENFLDQQDTSMESSLESLPGIDVSKSSVF